MKKACVLLFMAFTSVLARPAPGPTAPEPAKKTWYDIVWGLADKLPVWFLIVLVVVGLVVFLFYWKNHPIKIWGFELDPLVVYGYSRDQDPHSWSIGTRDGPLEITITPERAIQEERVWRRRFENCRKDRTRQANTLTISVYAYKPNPEYKLMIEKLWQEWAGQQQVIVKTIFPKSNGENEMKAIIDQAVATGAKQAGITDAQKIYVQTFNDNLERYLCPGILNRSA
jgi:hypothetical protein